jgi:hypothetical protein
MLTELSETIQEQTEGIETIKKTSKTLAGSNEIALV